MDKPSPPLDTPVTCEECLYYDDITGKKGYCRRYAPRPVHGSNDITEGLVTQWPIVLVYDACGDARSIHT